MVAPAAGETSTGPQVATTADAERAATAVTGAKKNPRKLLAFAGLGLTSVTGVVATLQFISSPEIPRPGGQTATTGTPAAHSSTGRAAVSPASSTGDAGPFTGVIVTEKIVKITQQIRFVPGEDRIDTASLAILDAVADILTQNPMKIEIQGHTDDRGSPAYLKELSERRAIEVRKYLIYKGIKPERLIARGYGMERPIVANTSPENRALNQRVQFVRTQDPPASR